MSGKLFNFLCSQLESKNSRRTIDLSVNLIFRRIHVYQNAHVPIYRFPSVFFYIFSQKEFFMLTNGTTYQTANRLDRFVGFELLVIRFISITKEIYSFLSFNSSKGKYCVSASYFFACLYLLPSIVSKTFSLII